MDLDHPQLSVAHSFWYTVAIVFISRHDIEGKQFHRLPKILMRLSMSPSSLSVRQSINRDNYDCVISLTI